MNVYYIAERSVTCSADRCNRAATSNGLVVGAGHGWR